MDKTAKYHNWVALPLRSVTVDGPPFSVPSRVGSFGHFFKKRELFDKIRIVQSLFFVQVSGLAQEGPLPGNFTQFRSLSLCLCTFYSN